MENLVEQREKRLPILAIVSLMLSVVAGIVYKLVYAHFFQPSLISISTATLIITVFFVVLLFMKNRSLLVCAPPLFYVLVTLLNIGINFVQFIKNTLTGNFLGAVLYHGIIFAMQVLLLLVFVLFALSTLVACTGRLQKFKKVLNIAFYILLALHFVILLISLLMSMIWIAVAFGESFGIFKHCLQVYNPIKAISITVKMMSSHAQSLYMSNVTNVANLIFNALLYIGLFFAHCWINNPYKKDHN